MAGKRPTVADIRANKGKRQYTMLRTETMEELEAAKKAGIDMVSVPPAMMLRRDFRDAAPTLFAVPGDNFYEIGTADDFIRCDFQIFRTALQPMLSFRVMCA